MHLRTKFLLLIAGSILIPVLVMLLVFLTKVGDPSGRMLPFELHRMKRSLREIERQGGEPYIISERLQAISPSIEILIVDRACHVVFSSTQAATLQGFLSSARPGSRYAFIHSDMPSLSGEVYSLVVGYPTESEPGGERWYAMLIFPGSFLTFISLMSIFIIRSINSSISRLETATRRISDGDLDFHLEAKGSDRIASLTRSFDRMRERVKEDSAARSRFLMGVSHDLKTPLAGITGYLDAITDGMASSPERLDKYLAIIRDKTRLLESRIKQLIDFVKLDTNDWQRGREHVLLGPFLEEAAAVFSSEAQVRGFDFESRIEIRDDLEISMDCDLVLRVLENLVNNAFRFAEPGSAIGFQAVRRGDQIALQICNQGEGIAAQDMPHLFEPFFRGTKTRKEPGFGLGLAVVKFVVASHDWDIGVTSQGGKTCFAITIPLPDPVDAADPAAVDDSADVDDSDSGL